MTTLKPANGRNATTYTGRIFTIEGRRTVEDLTITAVSLRQAEQAARTYRNSYDLDASDLGYSVKPAAA